MLSWHSFYFRVLYLIFHVLVWGYFFPFNPSRAASHRVTFSPNSLLGEGCSSLCLWPLSPPQPPPSSSGGWNQGETFCLNVTRGQVKKWCRCQGWGKAKILGEEGLSQTAGKWARQSAWPLRFSYGEPQAMLQALQSKNKPQLVLNFHFSPLSYLSKSIFLMFFQGVRARNRQSIDH